MKRSGVTDLPLHTGKVPRWLFQRMVKLGKGISDAIVYEYGSNELLKRLSDPYWFQALSCVLGFDWHSSGTTTTTCGALKLALSPEEHGLAVAGGKGRASRETQNEIETIGNVFSFDTNRVDKLKNTSRIVAKVDNSCIQDGYQLYHHSFVLSEKGEWTVVQQGLNTDGYARRYQWHSGGLSSLIEEPHSGISTAKKEKIVLDMTSKSSRDARETSVDLIKDGPEHIMRYLASGFQKTLTEFSDARACVKALKLPRRHAILDSDIGKHGMSVLNSAYEAQPGTYEELISIRGVGPKIIRALALISELVYGDAVSWTDPARFSFAHGGKDGIPYPVDRKTYDSSITILSNAIDAARLEKKEKELALKRLHSHLSHRTIP